MAKKCSTCKRSYPDHLPACPYCEPAKAKPPSGDDLVVDDIEVVADEASKPPSAKAPRAATAASEPLEVIAEDEPLEVVEEVPSGKAPRPPQAKAPPPLPPEVVAADEALEVVDVIAPGDSGRVRLDQPVEVVGPVSDVLVADSGVPLGGQPVDVAGPPISDVLVVDDAEVVEEPASAKDVLEVVDAAEPAPPPPPEPPQGRMVPPTQLAARSPAPTMLAPQEELERLAAEAPPSGPQARAGAPPAAPPAPEAPPKGGAQPTRIASRAPAPTMLAPTDIPDELPNLELDSGKTPARAPAEDVVEVAGDEALEVVEEVSGETVELPPEKGVAGKGKGEEASALDLLEGGSGVELGGEPSAKGERSSGVDLIAEALESGVDVPGVSPAGRKRPPRPSEIDLASPTAEGPDSSAVDLGGALAAARARDKEAAEEVVEEAEEVAEAAEEVAEAAEAVEEVVDEKVLEEFGVAEAAEEVVDEDLVAPKSKAKPKAEEAEEAAEAVDEDLVVPKARDKAGAKAVAEVEEEPAARRRPRDDEEDEPRRRRRQGGGFFRFVATLLFGILLAGGALAAVWYFAPDVLSGIPESPNKKGYKWQGASKEQENQIKALQAALAEKEDENKKYRDAEAELKGKSETLEGKLANLRSAEKRVKAALAQLKGKLTFPEEAEGVPEQVDFLAKSFAKQVAQLAGMNESLKEAGLTDGAALDPKDFKALADRLADARKAVDALAKELESGKKSEDLLKAVGNLAAARDALKEINKKLADAGVKDKAGKGVEQLVKDRDALQTQKKELTAAVNEALKELRLGNFVKPGDDPKEQLVKAVHTARLKAESPLASSLGQMFSSLGGLGAGAGKLLQRGLDSTADKAALAAAKVRQALTETPEQRLDTNIALLQGGSRKDPGDVASASKYLKWATSKEAKIPPETQAKAMFVLALAQRNNGQFADATASLQKSLKAAEALKTLPAWAGPARQTLKELTVSTAYYLPRAEHLRAAGKLKDALVELSTGLDAIPGDSRLHALRGLIRLELAPGPGKLDNKTQLLIEQDVAAARKDAAQEAEAYYVQGRLQERLGRFAQAEKSYRKALDAHKGTPEEASRYHSALARLLLRERPPGDEEPPAKGKRPDIGRLRGPREVQLAGGRLQVAEPEERSSNLQSAIFNLQSANLLAAVLMTTAVQPPPPDDDEDEDAAKAKRLKEVLELAEKMIKSPNPKTKGEGYMIKGEVFAKRGKRGEGILWYVKGLEMFYPGKETGEMAKLISEHPAFQQPDTMPRHNPLLAERHFGRGLDYFWQRRYKEAENQFKQAVANYDQDARYLYYLGLARYQQQTKAKREAARYDFGAAAKLEGASRPSSAQVNASLERLQGTLRQVLDRYRARSGGSD
jgi:tetratricopeptide (TPR) repeat protein